MRICRVYEGEGGKVVLFSLVGGLLQAGVAIGFAASDSLFLSNLGSQKLPYVYFILPAVMFLVAPLVSYLTQKLGVYRLQTVTNFILFAGGVCIALIDETALAGHPLGWLYYYGIKIYSSIFYICVFTIYWNFVDAYFDILSAKRLFPVFSGMGMVGATAGGYAVTAFMDHGWAVSNLYLIWAGLGLAANLPMWRIGKRFSYIEAEEEEETSAFWDQIRTVGRAYRKTKYVLFFTLSSFSLMFITNICEFQYMRAFELRYTDERELAKLFGYLFMYVNIFNTVVTFIVFNRLVTRIGVRNTALIQPTAYIVTFVAFIAVYGNVNPMFYAAIFAFFAFQGVQTAIEYNNYNLMLNPVPKGVKARVRAFTEGVSDPVGGALAGLCLLVLDRYLSWNHLQVSVAAVGLTAVYMGIVLCLRHHYVGAMLGNLRKEWLDFSEADAEIFEDMDEPEIETLVRQGASEDLENAVAACRILWLKDRKRAVRMLLQLLERGGGAELECIYEVLAEMLAARDGEVLLILIDWVMNHERDVSNAVIQELGRYHLIPTEITLRMLKSRHREARGTATAVLWNSWDVEQGCLASTALRSLLEGGDKERVAGIRSLGHTGQSRYAIYLTKYLHDPEPEVRRAAQIAVADLADSSTAGILPTILSALDEDDEAVRSAGFQALERIRDSNAIPLMLSKARSFSPFERRKAQQAIARMELRSVPACAQVLCDVTYPYAGRSIAVRAVARSAFAQLQYLVPKLVEAEVPRAYQMLQYHAALEALETPSYGLEVLSRFYRDEQITTLEFILEILALGGQLPSHELIATSLRSKSPKTRGNAMETLEQAVDRSTFNLLLPLIDGRAIEDRIAFYLRHYKADRMSPEKVLNAAWDSHVEVERSAAAQAQWELAASGWMPAGSAATEDFQLSRVRERLGYGIGAASSLVRDTVFSILQHEGDRSALRNSIQRTAILARTRLFSQISTMDLFSLGAGARPHFYQDGERIYAEGDVADCIYAIESGEVRLVNGDTKTCGEYDCFGEEILRGIRTCPHSASAAGSVTVYRLDRDHLSKCARTYPRIALGFLEVQVSD